MIDLSKINDEEKIIHNLTDEELSLIKKDDKIFNELTTEQKKKSIYYEDYKKERMTYLITHTDELTLQDVKMIELTDTVFHLLDKPIQEAIMTNNTFNLLNGELVVNYNESLNNYEEKKKKVLEKYYEDIEYDDLEFIDVYDSVYSKLPYKYKRIIKLASDTRAIFSQFGPEMMALLRDPNVNEINLNQDGYIRVDMFGRGKFKTNIIFDPDKADIMMRMIADYNKQELTEETPIISTNLPSGERIECLTGDVVNNCPVFSLRKRANRIFPLTEYVSTGKLTQTQKEYLENRILKGANVLIVGGVGTGKTTFANACISLLKNTNKRIVIIEDTPELICDCDNRVELTTTRFVNLGRLLQSSMRLNGDTVIVGELRRGEEVMVLTKIWNSGSKGGFSTVHADDAEAGLKKLEQYAREVVKGDIKEEIIQAVDIVVVLKKHSNSANYISQVAELESYDYENKQYILHDIL